MKTTTPPADPTPWDDFRAGWGARVREWKYGVHRLRQSLLAIVGLVIVAVYVLVALFAPVLAPVEESQRSPYLATIDFANQKKAPSPEHPFGTGESGVDIYYAVIWGARISMVMGLAITAVGIVVGVVLGGLAGYFGGLIDEVIMRVTDVFLAMPILIIAMAVAISDPFGFATRPDDVWKLVNIGIALAIVWWPSYTRLVRGQVLSIRENQYVEAARSVGASDGRIIFRHILPNSMSPVIVQATLDIGTVVLVSAALSFIGFGPGSNNFAEWGNLVSAGRSFMLRGWWGVTIPGLAILGFVLGFNLLGDGLRDLLDPRLRK